MVLYSQFILILAFNELVVDLDALSCSKGHKVKLVHGREKCEPCGDGYFQPTENASQQCRGCTSCNEGSFAIEKCTKVTDAKCQCHEGFVPYMADSIICKCDKGFELRQGVCSKCYEGYFSPSVGTACKKWKDCKETEVKIPGTSTTDATCNEAVRSYPPTVSTSNKSIALAETHPPHEGAETQTTHSTTTNLFGKTSVTEKVRPPPHSITGNHFGLAPLIFGIAVLLVLTAVIYKLYFSPCWQKTSTQHVASKQTICRAGAQLRKVVTAMSPL
ncbi:tumor necrosis factor receptor superfamily member 16 isoform 2-T2 [Odontesthes bonariensis]